MFRLLLADPDVRALLARERVFQHRADHQVLTAGGGGELIRLALQVRPAMIVFDADLLGDTLAATVAELRRSPVLRTTPIIATAAHLLEMEKRLRGSGVDLVLAKPVEKRRLYTVLRLAGPESGLDVRVAVGSQARYSVAGAEGIGRVANISRGGLYLEAERLHAVGTKMALRLTLPGFTDEIPVTAAVRWTNDGVRVPELPPGMGLQFVETPADALRTVAAYVVLARDVVRVT